MKENKFKERLKKMSNKEENYNDILNQWRKRSTYDLFLRNYDERLVTWNTDYNIGKCDICICKKDKLRYAVLMENIVNGKKCIVGSCCINKFTNKKLWDGVRTDIKIIKGTTEGKKYCQTCKRKIDKRLPQWWKFCDKCFTKKCNLYKKINDLDIDFDD
jgi:hypothetical protein